MNSPTIYADSLASLAFENDIVKIEFHSCQDDISTTAKKQVNNHASSSSLLVIHIENLLEIHSAIDSFLDDLVLEDIV